MNHLISGIKLILNETDFSTIPRYWINSGTVTADTYPEVMLNYDRAARVPQQEWRELIATEKKLLSDAHVGEVGSWISILKMPKTILTPFQALYNYSRAGDIESLKSLAFSQQLQPSIETVREFLTSLSIRNNQLFEGGFIFVGYPNKLTLTFAEGPRYIGLHVDSFYQVPLEERASSPNRICINLGAGDRYLYFINLPLLALKHQLDAVGSTDPRRFQIGSHLGSAFLDRFPNYPVVKLRIAPGEAYIAPTENIIHEGSSLGNPYFDVHLTFRGYFAAGW